MRLCYTQYIRAILCLVLLIYLLGRKLICIDLRTFHQLHRKISEIPKGSWGTRAKSTKSKRFLQEPARDWGAHACPAPADILGGNLLSVK